MNRKESLCLSAELDKLAMIRSFVQERASALGVEPTIVSDLLLAADEAATNVIIHGYQGRQGTIEIEVERERMDVVIRIRDRAPAFDPTSAPTPDLTAPLESRPPGGMGIYLIMQYMDEVIHRSPSQGGNELIMKKRAVSRRTNR